MASADLTFLGATQTVTGSKFLLTTTEARILIDCGMFQGLKELRLRNWDSLPFDPATLDAVLLTHAHIDHSGYLPRLVREGFRGPVYATVGTAALVRILLPDAARLEEEDAKFANHRGSSRHRPALPLYTEAEAHRALQLLKPLVFGQQVHVHGVTSVFETAGHILGASMIDMTIPSEEGGSLRVVFSGDLGRYGQQLTPSPTSIDHADYVILESTYGDRRHASTSVKAELAAIIIETVNKGGQVLIPSFAVDRAQQVLLLLHQLEEEGRIPTIPTFLDSPMAADATALYRQDVAELSEALAELLRGKGNPFKTREFKIITSFDDSRELARSRGPAVIISASGMATGGRVLQHLAAKLPDPRNTVVFVGYQAAGTRGRRLVNGEDKVKIFGEWVPVRARIAEIENLSAHADQDEILRWLGHFRSAPKRLFLVHGEPEAASTLQQKIVERYGWRVEIPDYGEEFDLA